MTKCGFVDKMMIFKWGICRENTDFVTICGEIAGEIAGEIGEILWGWGIY